MTVLSGPIYILGVSSCMLSAISINVCDVKICYLISCSTSIILLSSIIYKGSGSSTVDRGQKLNYYTWKKVVYTVVHFCIYVTVWL